MNLNEKTVLITGASSGIGEALALEFSRLGANVALFARRKEPLDALTRTIETSGRKSLVIQGDVNSIQDLDRATSDCISKFGGLDIVVANAGFGVVGNFEELSIQDYERQFETNVFGLLKTVKATLPELKKSKGQVVLVGSITGYFAAPFGGAYAMSKFAVRAFAESLRHEIRSSGVGVTLLSPGRIATNFRRVDNKGVFHPEAKDNLSPMHASVTISARQMVRAVRCRRNELVVTMHGKALVFISKYFSWMLNLAFRFGVKGRGSVEL